MGVEDEAAVVKAIVDRNPNVSTWMSFIYQYEGEGYTVEVPITDKNNHLVAGQEITLSLSILTEEK